MHVTGSTLGVIRCDFFSHSCKMESLPVPASLVHALCSEALMAAHIAATAEDNRFFALEEADVVAWQRQQRQQRCQLRKGGVGGGGQPPPPVAVAGHRTPPVAPLPGTSPSPCPINWRRFASDMCGRVRAVTAREALDLPRESGVVRAAALLRANRPLVQALVGLVSVSSSASCDPSSSTSSASSSSTSSSSFSSSSSSASTSSEADSEAGGVHDRDVDRDDW